MIRGARHASTPADETEAAVRDAADDPLLALVARLPLSPLGVWLPFLDCGAATAYRWASELRDRGLLTMLPTPLRTSGRPGRLWLPTDLGLAVLAEGGSPDPTIQAGVLGRRRLTPMRLITELPSLLSAYNLLAWLAAAGPGPAYLHSWERPWRRTLPARAEARVAVQRATRLPAAAGLAWDTPDGTLGRRYLLLPDTGGLALPAMRGTLGRLAEYQASSTAQAVLVIATTTARRAAAWTGLLETVCQTRRLPLLAVHATTWADLRTATPAPDQPPGRQQSLASRERPLVTASTASRADTPCTTSRGSVPSCCSPPSRAGRRWPDIDPGPTLGPLDFAVLDLVGRHPFLPAATLAAVLGHQIRWTRSRQAHLVARGLVRVLPPEEATPPELACQHLLELTRDGLQVLAAHLGLPLGAAVRHHGLAGGGPATPVGPRAALLGHLDHTVGADAVFAAIAAAAALHPAGGALLEWRGAAACAHGRLRPDGYGLVRLGQRQHGFFLEFDRGTMRPQQLRAKFNAYHRYRRDARAATSFAGFPTLLVVTTGTGAEERLARALRAADAGQGSPLPALLTTTCWLQATAGGPLGAVWRTSDNRTRRQAWA